MMTNDKIFAKALYVLIHTEKEKLVKALAFVDRDFSRCDNMSPEVQEYYREKIIKYQSRIDYLETLLKELKEIQNND